MPQSSRCKEFFLPHRARTRRTGDAATAQQPLPGGLAPTTHKHDKLNNALHIGVGGWVVIGLAGPVLIAAPCVLAFITSYYTPTIGFSCRTLTYILYLFFQVWLMVYWPSTTGAQPAPAVLQCREAQKCSEVRGLALQHLVRLWLRRRYVHRRRRQPFYSFWASFATANATPHRELGPGQLHARHLDQQRLHDLFCTGVLAWNRRGLHRMLSVFCFAAWRYQRHSRVAFVWATKDVLEWKDII